MSLRPAKCPLPIHLLSPASPCSLRARAPTHPASAGQDQESVAKETRWCRRLLRDPCAPCAFLQRCDGPGLIVHRFSPPHSFPWRIFAKMTVQPRSSAPRCCRCRVPPAGPLPPCRPASETWMSRRRGTYEGTRSSRAQPFPPKPIKYPWAHPSTRMICRMRSRPRQDRGPFHNHPRYHESRDIRTRPRGIAPTTGKKIRRTKCSGMMAVARAARSVYPAPPSRSYPSGLPGVRKKMASGEMGVRSCGRRRKSLGIGIKTRKATPMTNPNFRSHHPHRSLPIPRHLPHTRMNLSTGPPPAPSIPTHIPSSEEPPSALFRASNSREASRRGRYRSVIPSMATPWRINFGCRTRTPADASDITPCSPSPDKTRPACIEPRRSSGGLFDASPRAS